MNTPSTNRASYMKYMLEAFRFFRAHTNETAIGAISLARAEVRARDLGIEVTWDNEDRAWDGECEAPAVHARATVLHPDHADADTTSSRIAYPFFDRRDGSTGHVPEVLAACGGIGLESWGDPYKRVMEAELLSEALEELDAQRDVEATAGAVELASRATFAGPSDLDVEDPAPFYPSKGRQQAVDWTVLA